ncbi:MAG: ATP synthase F1 subunit delta [Bacteroidales bacterium]|nr:ATP synthase F1 subunit delta [Bacteroidales bacterium]
MKSILLAKRYAKALFDLAISDKITDKVNSDMELINAVLSENRELRKLMTNPVVPPARKKLVMKRIFEQHLQPLSLAFIDILIRKNREQEIQLISESYSELYLDYMNIAVVNLTTATAIEPALKQKIADLIGVKTQKTLRINNSVDAKLIGGFVLKMDDYQYDASIKRVIRRLHDEFDKNLFRKEF